MLLPLWGKRFVLCRIDGTVSILAKEPRFVHWEFRQKSTGKFSMRKMGGHGYGNRRPWGRSCWKRYMRICGRLGFQQKKRCADAHLQFCDKGVQRTENLFQKASRPPLKHSSMDTTAPKLAWKIWKGSFSSAALASA